MTKKEYLAEFALFEDFESAASAERAFNHGMAILKRELTAGNSVALGQDFGEFKTGMQAAKTGKVPGTDKDYSSPAKRVVKFSVSAPFKAAVAGNKRV